ncbi:MAG: hypothetical protein RL020_1254 [Pseudomonadota bacterium]|jgi:FecR protein
MKNINRTTSLFTLLGALLLTAFTSVAAAAEYVDPPSRAGRVSLIEGSVMFYEAQSGWRDAAINYPVTSQNSFATRGRSRVEVRVGSTALRIADDSQLDLLGVTDNMIDARLAQGSLNLRVRNLEPGDYVRVATPHTQAIIRSAGRYRIDADSQATRVTVLQGAAGVMIAGNQETTLYADSSTMVGGNNYSRQLETAQSDAFDEWARERDYRFERSRSAQYVSPEMTGYEDLDNHGAWRSDANYGNVWVPTYVASGWAPYQDGRWVHVQPWGWTWVDNAPWGFAPFHYGRWVQVNGFWAWAPGRIHARPVYAPALVAFVGDDGWQTSFSFGNAYAVGWFPLGWGEPYHPYYRCSNNYGRNLNSPHGSNYVHNDRHDQPSIHRSFTTIVPRDKFASPVLSAVQIVKSNLNPPIARIHPVAPPALVRAVMVPAPAVDRTVPGRIVGQAPVVQAAPVMRTPEPQPNHNAPWRRQPAPINPQPGVVQAPPQPLLPGRVVMQQPAPAAQPNLAQAPSVPAPANQDDRGRHHPWMNHPPQQNPIVRVVEPVRPPAPVVHAAPPPQVQQQPVQQPAQQPAPKAAPVAAVKADIDSHRRHREAGDNDGGERRIQLR